MLNQIAVISFLAALSGCPSQNQAPANYVNNYLIPEGHRGWLIVRNKPAGKTRPNEVTYRFDRQGFCMSDIDLGSGLFVAHYFYVDPSGRKTEISSDNHPDGPNSSGVYACYFVREGAATSPEYAGERWDFYFVGTPAEYESAKQNYPSFISQYHLYKTVTATQN